MSGKSTGDGAKCPKCDFARDGQLDAFQVGREAKPGDVTVCGKCLSVNIFQDDMTLCPMTEKERSELNKEERDLLKTAIEITQQTGAHISARNN